MSYEISDRIFCVKGIDNIEVHKHYTICGQGDLFMINTNRSKPIKGYGFNIKDCNENYFYVTLKEVESNFISSPIMENKIKLRDFKIKKILDL